MKLPAQNPGIVFRRVSEGAVLLSTDDEVYFGLNEVGAQIWEMMAEGASTFEELRDALAARYPDVERAQIETDLKELLDELAKAGMLQDA
jgi:hypothetical protein